MDYRIIGEWYDKWTNVETGEEVCNSGRNQIQNDCGKVFTEKLRRVTGESGSLGIQYLACGSGESGWDVTPPTQSYSQSTLTTEFYRQAVVYHFGGEIPYWITEFYFIDPITFIPTGGTPSRAVEAEIVIDAGDATGMHREFGLFGGSTATSSADTGYMVNWVVIDAHDKLVAEELTRTIRLFIVEN